MDATRFIARGDRKDGAGWVDLYDGASYEDALAAANVVHAETELAHIDCLDDRGVVIKRVV